MHTQLSVRLLALADWLVSYHPRIPQEHLNTLKKAAKRVDLSPTAGDMADQYQAGYNNAVTVIPQQQDQSRTTTNPMLYGRLLYQRNQLHAGIVYPAILADLLEDAATALVVQGEPCIWKFDDNDYRPQWDTSCGEAYCFFEGGPEDNNTRFCHGCGKPISVAATEPQEETNNEEV